METLELSSDFEKAKEGLYYYRSENFLMVGGDFYHLIKSEAKELPNEVCEIADNVEEIVRKAYPENEVKGIQLLTAEDPWMKYQGEVRVSKASELLMNFSMIVGHNPKFSCIIGDNLLEDWPFSFQLGFVLEEYEDNAKEVMTQIWPLVRGIGYDVASKRFIPPDILSNPGLISLFKDGKFKAKGYDALKKLGLDLPDKPYLLFGEERK